MVKNKNKKPSELVIPVNNIAVFILIGLLLIGAFYIGSLTTRIKQLENTPSQVVNNNAPKAVQAPKQADEVAPVTEDDWVRGDENARIALIEYSDLECPFCKKFHPTAQRIIDEYEGEVKWVYRHFPLDQIHAKADKEAEAAECAGKLGGNDGFWALTNKIFEVTPSNDGLDLDTLPDLAVDVGLDKTTFETCLNSGEMAENVETDYQSGLKAGVTGTPGNILLDTKTGKTRLLSGALPFEQVSQAIDQMLAE